MKNCIKISLLLTLLLTLFQSCAFHVKPTETAIATGSSVEELLKKTFPNAKIIVSLGTYLCPSYSELAWMIVRTNVEKLETSRDFNCTHIAKALLEKAPDGWAFGTLDHRTKTQGTNHRVNICITNKYRVYLIDGKKDTIWRITKPFLEVESVKI